MSKDHHMGLVGKAVCNLSGKYLSDHHTSTYKMFMQLQIIIPQLLISVKISVMDFILCKQQNNNFILCKQQNNVTSYRDTTTAKTRKTRQGGQHETVQYTTLLHMYFSIIIIKKNMQEVCCMRNCFVLSPSSIFLLFYYPNIFFFFTSRQHPS